MLSAAFALLIVGILTATLLWLKKHWQKTQQITDFSQLVGQRQEIEKFEAEIESKIESALLENLIQKKLDQALVAFEASLTGYSKQISQNLEQTLAQTSQKSGQFVENYQVKLLESQTQLEDQIKQQVTKILYQLEQNVFNFTSSSEQKSIQNIELELRSARELISSYKASQIAIVDENIISVLERTLSLVLPQKLTLKDSLDLVFEALEKAKKESFLK